MERKIGQLKQLCGPGIASQEACPPAYHVDLDRAGFEALLRNPTQTLQALGCDLVINHIIIMTGKAWSAKQRRWIAVDEIPSTMRQQEEVWCVFLPRGRLRGGPLD
jgi:hypothetical protein